MSKRTIEINDTLPEILQSAKDDTRDLAREWLDDNKDADEAPDLYNDLDHSGSFHELIDGAVPIYTAEIRALFYLYADDFEEAFGNAGIGDKDDDKWPCGWKPAAIYCYLEQEIAAWYQDEAGNIYAEWRAENPLAEDDD